MNDFYATMLLEKQENEYVGKFLTPLEFKVGHIPSLALCDFCFEDNSARFNNAKVSVFDIAIPKYTNDASGKTQFKRCQLENGEYDGAQLCESINAEIKNKLPSTFKKDKCYLALNERINKVELRIDGSSNVPEKERVTLIIYYPLSYYLGFTIKKERSETFTFVSIILNYLNFFLVVFLS